MHGVSVIKGLDVVNSFGIQCLVYTTRNYKLQFRLDFISQSWEFSKTTTLMLIRLGKNQNKL